MNKIEINIDKNIKYLGEIKNIELPLENMIDLNCLTVY